MLIWESSYCIGNEEIDRQHSHIVDLANTIEVAVTNGESMRTLDILLDHLARYIRLHFQVEERLMRLVGFPGASSHAAEHERCAMRLNQFLEDVRAGAVKRQQIADFVQEWVQSHMAQSDRGLVPYIEEDREVAAVWALAVRGAFPPEPVIN